MKWYKLPIKWYKTGKELTPVLIGEYNHNLDAKGRTSIPSKFRDDLGGNFVLSKGLDDCLYAYSKEEWEGFQNELLALKGSDGLKVRRFFLGGATECEIDSLGRVVIPQPFRDYAGLSREIVILGVANRAEIWDREKWNKYMSDSSFDSDEIAKAMERLGI